MLVKTQMHWIYPAFCNFKLFSSVPLRNYLTIKNFVLKDNLLGGIRLALRIYIFNFVLLLMRRNKAVHLIWKSSNWNSEPTIKTSHATLIYLSTKDEKQQQVQDGPHGRSQTWLTMGIMVQTTKVTRLHICMNMESGWWIIK